MTNVASSKPASDHDASEGSILSRSRGSGLLKDRRHVLKWTEPEADRIRIVCEDLGSPLKISLVGGFLLSLLAFAISLMKAGSIPSGRGWPLTVIFLLGGLVMSAAIAACLLSSKTVTVHSHRLEIRGGVFDDVVQFKRLRKCLLEDRTFGDRVIPMLRGIDRTGRTAFEVIWNDSVSETRLASVLGGHQVAFKSTRPRR